MILFPGFVVVIVLVTEGKKAKACNRSLRKEVRADVSQVTSAAQAGNTTAAGFFRQLVAKDNVCDFNPVV